MSDSENNQVWLMVGSLMGFSLVGLFSTEWWPDVPYAPIMLFISLAISVHHVAYRRNRFDQDSISLLITAILTSAILTISTIYGTIALTASVAVTASLAWRMSPSLGAPASFISLSLAGAGIVIISFETLATGFIIINVLPFLLALALILESTLNNISRVVIGALYCGGVAGLVLFRHMNGNIEMVGIDAVFHLVVASAFIAVLQMPRSDEEE